MREQKFVSKIPYKISNKKDKQMNKRQALYLKERIQIFYTTKFFKITRSKSNILIFSI